MGYQGFFEILMITLISSKNLGVYRNMKHTVRTLKKLAKRNREYQSQNFPMKQKSFKSWQIHIHYSETFTFL